MNKIIVYTNNTNDNELLKENLILTDNENIL